MDVIFHKKKSNSAFGDGSESFGFSFENKICRLFLRAFIFLLTCFDFFPFYLKIFPWLKLRPWSVVSHLK